VTRHLMHGDFSRYHPLHWYLSGVRTMRVNACPGLYGVNARPMHTTSALISLNDSRCASGQWATCFWSPSLPFLRSEASWSNMPSDARWLLKHILLYFCLWKL